MSSYLEETKTNIGNPQFFLYAYTHSLMDVMSLPMDSDEYMRSIVSSIFIAYCTSVITKEEALSLADSMDKIEPTLDYVKPLLEISDLIMYACVPAYIIEDDDIQLISTEEQYRLVKDFEYEQAERNLMSMAVRVENDINPDLFTDIYPLLSVSCHTAYDMSHEPDLPADDIITQTAHNIFSGEIAEEYDAIAHQLMEHSDEMMTYLHDRWQSCSRTYDDYKQRGYNAEELNTVSDNLAHRELELEIATNISNGKDAQMEALSFLSQVRLLDLERIKNL